MRQKSFSMNIGLIECPQKLLVEPFTVCPLAGRSGQSEKLLIIIWACKRTPRGGPVILVEYPPLIGHLLQFKDDTVRKLHCDIYAEKLNELQAQVVKVINFRNGPSGNRLWNHDTAKIINCESFPKDDHSNKIPTNSWTLTPVKITLLPTGLRDTR